MVPPHPEARWVNSVPRMIKAEVGFAAIAVLRHRSARLVSLLAVVTLGLMVWQDAGTDVVPDRHEAGWVLMSVIAVVWFPRVLAPGGALEAARIVGARWWIAPAGRAFGVVCLMVPVVIILGYTAGSAAWSSSELVRFFVGGLSLAGTLGLLCMAVTPFIGSSASASIGFLLAMAGGVTPEAFELVLTGWARTFVTFVWHVLPLQWRAEDWLGGGDRVFLAVSGTWNALSVVIGAVAVGWRGLVGRLRQ
jgi:hypothetical protein